MKDFLEKQILLENEGYEENERTYNGDSETDSNISIGYASPLSPMSKDVLTANALCKRNTCILKEQLDVDLHLAN